MSYKKSNAEKSTPIKADVSKLPYPPGSEGYKYFTELDHETRQELKTNPEIGKKLYHGVLYSDLMIYTPLERACRAEAIRNYMREIGHPID